MGTWSDPVLLDRPLEPYNSSDPATIERHVKQARQAGIDVLASAWFGPTANNPTEANFKTLLGAVGPEGLRAALLIETDSNEFFPSLASLRTALSYALEAHVKHPAYFRFKGKPVIVFWRPRAIWIGSQRANKDGPASVEAWRRLRDEVDPNRTSLWIAEGEHVPYLDVFDGMVPYSIAWANDPATQLARYAAGVKAYRERTGTQKLWIATAMPGYDDTRLIDRRDRFAVARRNGAFYRQTFAGAVASDPEWINITSFNEWVEGHQIEPSVSDAGFYLDLTRQLVDEWKRKG
jgi:hypothetical protein